MVPLDRALVSSYRLSIATMSHICSGLAAICNASILVGGAGSLRYIGMCRWVGISGAVPG